MNRSTHIHSVRVGPKGYTECVTCGQSPVRRQTYEKPRTRLVWNKERIALTIGMSALFVAIALWAFALVPA